MSISNLISPKYTVEEIHAEFDSAQNRLQKQAEKILSTLAIPTESAIERKAKLAQELGFVNSEVVTKSKSIFERNSEIQKTIEITRLQVDTLNELRFNYPNEKFLTVEELDRICSKYNLIHCPIANYIKDIPEKNLLEIKNVKKIMLTHCVEKESIVKNWSWYNWNGNLEYKNRYIFPSESIVEIPSSFTVPQNVDNDYKLAVYLTKKYFPNESRRICINNCVIEVFDKSGLFIAAPPSHFDTKGLSKKDKFGWFNVQTIEVKDPVVFEYCKNGFIRVVTKWGTEDDQSYLDPALFNEKLN